MPFSESGWPVLAMNVSLRLNSLLFNIFLIHLTLLIIVFQWKT